MLGYQSPLYGRRTAQFHIKPFNFYEVASYYNISAKDIKGSSRSAKIAEARQVAIYLSRELTKQSFPAIGDFFDKKHTTILYSYDKVKEELKTNKSLSHSIDAITNQICK